MIKVYKILCNARSILGIDSSIWTLMIRLELCIDSIPQGRCNITTAIQRASKYSKLLENFLKISREKILNLFRDWIKRFTGPNLHFFFISVFLYFLFLILKSTVDAFDAVDFLHN